MKPRTYLSVAPLVLLAAWGASAALSTDYRVIDSDSEPIRADFNANVGKVRVVALVAPT